MAKKLFGYSYMEAVQQIKKQKSNCIRYRVSKDHWNLVRSQKEAEGFTREAYEHWIEKGSQSLITYSEEKRCNSDQATAESSYLVLLDGILDTPENFATLPICPIHHTQSKHLQRKETLSFVALMVLSSNASTYGFHVRNRHSIPLSSGYLRPRKI